MWKWISGLFGQPQASYDVEIIERRPNPQERFYTLRCPTCETEFRVTGKAVQIGTVTKSLHSDCPVCETMISYGMHDHD